MSSATGLDIVQFVGVKQRWVKQAWFSLSQRSGLIGKRYNELIQKQI